MEIQEKRSILECLLFVAGDAVPVLELQRVMDMTELELKPLLFKMQNDMNEEKRGIQLSITEETVQLVSNRAYAKYVEDLLQPAQQKTFSQTLIETLAIVAYRQPVTRADIEAVRGVRCEYAVAQLQKLNMICMVGRKESVGRPTLYGTTDAFLRHFGLQLINELPNYEEYSRGEEPCVQDTLTV